MRARPSLTVCLLAGALAASGCQAHVDAGGGGTASGAAGRVSHVRTTQAPSESPLRADGGSATAGQVRVWVVRLHAARDGSASLSMAVSDDASGDALVGASVDGHDATVGGGRVHVPGGSETTAVSGGQVSFGPGTLATRTGTASLRLRFATAGSVTLHVPVDRS